MKKFAALLSVAIVGIAGCGGGSNQTHQKSHLIRTFTAPSGQRTYLVRLPNGKVVRQAHDPALAQPSSKATLPRRATGVSTVEQYDSVTLSTIPSGSRFLAGYVNGHYQTYSAMKRSFPGATVVGISVSTDNRTYGGADCLDMEPGNPGPWNAGPWAKWQMNPINGNTRPCEYSMESWFGQINASLSQWGVSVCHSATQNYCVREWDANWTYVAHLDSGYACTQWTDHSLGRNLDESTCATWFYNRSNPPRPGPSPARVKSLISARGKSLHAYYQHGCRYPVLTTGTCGQLAWRVDHFQKLVDTAHGYYPLCFGKHTNKTAAECQIVRPAVARWSNARSSTGKAEGRNGCHTSHQQNATCKALNQRYIYFDKRVSKTLRTSRF